MDGMICQISTQLSSDAEAVRWEENQDPEQRLRLLGAMAAGVDALRLCRVRKLTRDAHHRQYAANPQHFKDKAKNFRTSPDGRAFYAEYERMRRKNQPYYHFLNWLRGSINRDLRRQHAPKGGRTESLIGCSFEELRFYLESQFTNEMSWKTRSQFDIDHHVPVSAFNLNDPEERRWAFNWQNLRPLRRLENRTKSAKLPIPLPSWLPMQVTERILTRKKNLQPLWAKDNQQKSDKLPCTK